MACPHRQAVVGTDLDENRGKSPELDVRELRWVLGRFGGSDLQRGLR